MRIREDAERRQTMERMHARMQEVRAEVERRLAEGLISEAEAKDRIAAAERELHEQIRSSRFHLRRAMHDDAVRAKILGLHKDLEDQIAAGRISREEARERIHAAVKVVHEELRQREAKLAKREHNELVEEHPDHEHQGLDAPHDHD